MRYMICSGVDCSAASLTRSLSHCRNARASSVKPRPSSAYTENEASRIQVNR